MKLSLTPLSETELAQVLGGMDQPQAAQGGPKGAIVRKLFKSFVKGAVFEAGQQAAEKVIHAAKTARVKGHLVIPGPILGMMVVPQIGKAAEQPGNIGQAGPEGSK